MKFTARVFVGIAAFSLPCVSICGAETPTTGGSDVVTVASPKLRARPKDDDESGNEAVNAEDQWQDLYQAKVFVTPGNVKLPYRILCPKNFPVDSLADHLDEESKRSGVEETQQTYPLVLFLHGAGERGDDNVKQLVHCAVEFSKDKRRTEYPSFVVFPQCPVGKRWVESDWSLSSGKGAFPTQESEPMASAMTLLSRLSETLPIDKTRVYIAGLSMGGMGTWYAAARHPERFAAMVEICGGGDPSWAQNYAGIPIWVFHGGADTVVPVSRGREMVNALVEHGHWPEVRYVEYPGVGHNSWTRTFARDDVFAWLYSHRKELP